ncbi:MAG: hypothetical protein WC510_01865 [Candidatus Omnitrophota bacterium]
MIKKDYGAIEIKRGEIVFDGVDLKRISKEYETPFFLMSERQLESNYESFLKAFSGIAQFRVFYSVKTNFESGVLKTLHRLGSGAEISGGQDFLLARKAGFAPRNIVFDGPCKKDAEIIEAIEGGVHCINAESIEELEKIEKISSKAGARVNVGIRVDPLVDSHYYDALIDTYKRKFGYPVREAMGIFALARQFPHLNLMAIHAHIGSQLFDISMYTRSLDSIFRLISELKKIGVEIKELNIGGGFPAQGMRNVKISRRLIAAQLLERLGFNIERNVPSIFDFGKQISDAYNRNSEKYGVNPVLTTEPGRCIVSSVAILVGKVVSQKRNWVFTDISVNDIAENIFFSERDYGFPGKMGAKIKRVVNISGPTLSTADVLYLKEKVPGLEAGDPIVIFDVGAYSIPRSTQFTQPRKAVYFITKDREIKLIRARETYEDVIKNQVW